MKYEMKPELQLMHIIKICLEVGKEYKKSNDSCIEERIATSSAWLAKYRENMPDDDGLLASYVICTMTGVNYALSRITKKICNQLDVDVAEQRLYGLRQHLLYTQLETEVTGAEELQDALYHLKRFNYHDHDGEISNKIAFIKSIYDPKYSINHRYPLTDDTLNEKEAITATELSELKDRFSELFEDDDKEE